MNDILNRYTEYGEQLYRMTGGVIGCIVPASENGRIVERSLLRSVASRSKKLRRPFAWVGFDRDSGMMLYYKHCMTEDFVNTEEYPAGTELKGDFSSPRTPEQQAEYESALWECYEKIRDFALDNDLSGEQKELVRRYKKQWELTVMTGLLPYYKALSPEFFEWLGKQ